MKKLFLIVIYFSLIFSSCKKEDEEPVNSNNNNNLGLSIGDTYGGGIIFYLNSNGGGLVASPSDQDQGFIQDWGCSGTDITGADGTGIGTGYQNTIDIESECTTPGTPADICANFDLNGYSDWFLPSINECDEMYKNIGQANILGLGNIGEFNNCNYWSSSEIDENYAWAKAFYDHGSGGQGELDKSNPLSDACLRCIREFN